MLRIESYSDEQTEKLGEMLGRILCAGDVVTLDGDLGAGKIRGKMTQAGEMDFPDRGRGRMPRGNRLSNFASIETTRTGRGAHSAGNFCGP